MKIKLKLTRIEMKGIATVVQNCCNAISGEEFEAVQYRDALAGLLLKLAAKIPTLRNTNRMTLTDIEALALHETLRDLVGQLPPLEMSVGLAVLGEIDRQRMVQVSLMKGNLGQLLIGRCPADN